VRGEYPVQDFKYDILHHPNVSRTTDGGAESYRHGEDLHSFAVLGVNETLLKACKENPVDEDDYLFFSEEELEELLKKKMEEMKHEQEKQAEAAQ